METSEFIVTVLNGMQSSLDTILEGLTPTEIAWQPTKDLNSIGLILFHTARSEDFFVQEITRRNTQVWEKDEWYKRFNFPKEERGRHYKAEQVNSFVTPSLENLKSYYVAVRKENLAYIEGLTIEDFNKEVKTPRRETTVGGFLANVVNHTAQHIGEMSYLRGLQRGLNQ